MAGTIIADFIRADANKFSINVGNTIIASVNALGILSNTGNVMISSAGAITANNISTGRIVTPSVMPANSILQIVQTVKSDTFSMTGTTWTDVTGFSVTITPTSATSKILVMGHINLGSSSYLSYVKLLRNSTDVYIADVGGSRVRPTATFGGYAGGGNEVYNISNIPFMYLDSPATTSATTYKMQIKQYAAGNYAVVNRTYADRDDGTGSYDPRTVSSIMVMEIAQ